MKLLRILLILLLAIAIPLEGLAAVRMIDMMSINSVPMEMTQMASGADETCVMNMAQPDPSSKSTAPCKMGNACKICQIFPSTTSAASVTSLTLPLIDTVSLLPDSLLSSRDPSGLWRPPRSL